MLFHTTKTHLALLLTQKKTLECFWFTIKMFPIQWNNQNHIICNNLLLCDWYPNVPAMVSQKWLKGDLHIFHQNVSRLSLVKEYFPIIICSAVWLRQLAKWGYSQIFAKIWGNFPIYAKTRDEANKISK